MKNINSNIKQLNPEDYKFFFKRYYLYKNGNKPKEESETDSTYDDLPENNYELNTIYLRNLNNLNKFLQKKNNLRGITLRGNKLLENISLNKFNEFFREYGKSIEKKLKKHVLKFFYPNNNKPKLMGQKMNLTPIPVKRNIYLRNEKEKKDYKNAERAAVIMRRLEYTYGLGDKRNKNDKILFYLMKGAALIIEDWWISILNNKKKDENYNTLRSKINKIEKNNKDNTVRQNRFAFKQRDKGLKSGKNMENNRNKNMNKINNKKGKVNKNKKNKIEIIEINLDEEQPKNNKENKLIKDIQTEPRNSAPLNSKIDLNILNNSTKNKSGKKNKENKENNDIIKKNKNNNLKKTENVPNIFEKNNNNNKYEIKIDKFNNKEKKIKPNPIKLIVTKSIMTENKNKEDKIINKNFNNKISSNNNFNNNQNIPLSNRLNNLLLKEKYDIKKTSSAKKYKASSYKKEPNNNNANLNKINSNKLFQKGNNISKSPNLINNKDKIEKIKSQNCKVKSQPKIKLNKEDYNINDRNKKGSKKKEKIVKDNKQEFVIENNINLLIANDYRNSEKRNNKFKLNISNDNIINNNVNNINDNNIEIDMNESNKNKNLKENDIDNNTNIDSDLKKNKSISVVSVIGYRLKDDDFYNKNILNSVNNIDNKNKINKNNELINIKEKDDNNINEIINNEENEKNEEIDNDKFNNISNINKEQNDNNINQSKKEFSENNNINENSIKNINNQNEINNGIKEINIRKESSDINQEGEEIRDNNINNNILIHINESNNENNKEKINDSKKEIIIPELNIENNNNLINNNIHSKNEESKNSNNSLEIEEGSFKFNKNSFFFNNSNNVIMVNIDNNSEYDETEIKRINLKKNYYAKYTTNIIKININNTDYNIINKKKEENNICLTDKNELNSNQKRKSKSSENIIDSKKGPKTLRQEKDIPKIKYTIIPNSNKNNNNKPITAAEKTSFDGSVDEIISNQLMKIHNNNNEINKQRIDKVYNNIQLRKSQNLNNNINNNFEKIENDTNNNNEKDSKMIKSKSSGKLKIKNDIDLNHE